MANPLPGIVSAGKGPPPKTQPPPNSRTAGTSPQSARRAPSPVSGSARPGRAGARDGLGSGGGGVACSGEMSSHGINQYEGRHTSKTR